MAAKKPRIIAIEEHYLDAEVKAHFSAGRRDEAAAGSPSGSTISATCASRRWTRPASTSRCCRTARPSTQKMRCPRPRCALARARQRPAARGGAAPSDRFAAFAALPTPDPKARRRRARAHRDQVRLQGRDDARPDQRRLPRRQALLADLRARRRRSTCRSISIPAMPHPGGDRGLLQGLRQGLPDAAARRLGLHRRDRDPGHPPGAVAACSTPIPSLKIILGHLGEGLPFLLWRINSALSREGNKPLQFPRALLRAFLDHDQRLLLEPGAAVLRAGARRRPHHLLGRLSVRAEQAGGRLDPDHSALRRGQGEDPVRQCREAAEARSDATCAPKSSSRCSRRSPACPASGRAWQAVRAARPGRRWSICCGICRSSIIDRRFTPKIADAPGGRHRHHHRHGRRASAAAQPAPALSRALPRRDRRSCISSSSTSRATISSGCCRSARRAW